MKKFSSPKELFEIAIKKSNIKLSSRALSEWTGKKIKKDVINGMLKGELKHRDEFYFALAKRLGIDRSEIEASLTWARLSTGARSVLIERLNKTGSFPSKNSLRENLLKCLPWVIGSSSVPESYIGAIFLRGEIRLLIIFPEEFSSLKEMNAFLIEKKREIDERIAGTIFVTQNEIDPSKAKSIKEWIINNFKTFRLVRNFQELTQTNERTAILTKEIDLINWLFLYRFNPKYYLDRLRKDENLQKVGNFPYAQWTISSISNGAIYNAENFIQNWATSSGDHPLLILEGSFGMGKTTILQRLVDSLLGLVLQNIEKSGDLLNDDLPIPIFAPMTKWIKSESTNPLYKYIVETVFADARNKFGDRPFDPDIPLDAFKVLSKSKQKFIIIIDGMDEAIRLRQTMKTAIDESRKMIEMGHKVIIATRPEVFYDQQEVDQTLNYIDTIRVRLMALSNEEVDKYINKILDSYPVRIKLITELITKNEEAREVFCHPLFLNYCCRESQERLETLKDISSYHEPYSLFEFFTSEWLNREETRKNPIFNELIEFMEEVAIEISIRKENIITDEFMPLFIRGSLDNISNILQGKSSIEVEEVEREARVCSFVTVNMSHEGVRNYSFNLRSFASYFIAKRLVRELSSEDKNIQHKSLGRVRLTEADLDMIASGIKTLKKEKLVKSHLIELIELTGKSKFCRHWKYRHLGGNAASIYTKLNNNKFDINLQGVSLCGFQLDNGIISGKWDAIDLSESKITNCDLSALEGNYIYCFESIISGVNETGQKSGFIEFPSGQLSQTWENTPQLEEFCFIPPGNFKFGEKIQKPIKMHGFFMGKNEATNYQLSEFININQFWSKDNFENIHKKITEKYNRAPGSTAHYLKDIDPEKKRNHPVTYLPKLLMEEFCDHLNGRLPTEAEWEFAVKGSMNNEEIAELIEEFYTSNPNLDEIQSVTSFKESNYGLKGMIGNVKELCHDCFWPDLNIALQVAWESELNPFFRPLRITRDVYGGPVNPINGIIRGVSYANPHAQNPIYGRGEYNLVNMDEDVGFRCVIDIHIGLAKAKNLDLHCEEILKKAKS